MLQPRTIIRGLAAGVILSRFYHLQARNWGATILEQSRPLPGDDMVPEASTVTTMAISIDAPPEDVWPWLVQMGSTRPDSTRISGSRMPSCTLVSAMPSASCRSGRT